MISGKAAFIETIQEELEQRRTAVENTTDKLIDENMDALSELTSLIQGDRLWTSPEKRYELTQLIAGKIDLLETLKKAGRRGDIKCLH